MATADNPESSVQGSLILLADQLDPVVQQRLEGTLNGLPWPAILQELDGAAGRRHAGYGRHDLQCQLRMLTERLGNLGFPFDPPNREVSILGGELRIIRNRWAHQDPLTWMDAWRTADFSTRLVSALNGPDAGAFIALGEAALAHVVEERGLSPARPATKDLLGPADESEANDGGPDDSPSTSPTLVRREGSPASLTGDEVVPYEPWTVVLQDGGRQVIEDLPKKYAKEQVRALAREITDFEGPIEIRRLARLIAGSFGISRLAAKRRDQIIRQIRASGIHVDTDGFAWPDDIDPETWSAFRPTDPSTPRSFTDISPVEVRNARTALTQKADDSVEVVDRMVLAVFGKTRLTGSTRKYLHVSRVGEIF